MTAPLPFRLVAFAAVSLHGAVCLDAPAQELPDTFLSYSVDVSLDPANKV